MTNKLIEAADELAAAARGWLDGNGTYDGSLSAALTAYRAARESAGEVELPDVDELAQVIRRVDGNNNLGAGALAEAIRSALAGG